MTGDGERFFTSLFQNKPEFSAPSIKFNKMWFYLCSVFLRNSVTKTLYRVALTEAPPPDTKWHGEVNAPVGRNLRMRRVYPPLAGKVW